MKRPEIYPDDPAEIKVLFRHDLQEMWDSSINKQAWNSYRNQLLIYEALAGPVKLKILDVGCAQATMAMLLAENGHEVTALDIRKNFIEYAKRRYERGNINFVVSSVFDNFTNDTFDLIYANQIIEHIIEPQKFLNQMKLLLRPGGRLIITTPNGEYLGSKLPTFREIELKNYISYANSADGDSHFFAYTKEELTGELKAAGLHPIQVRYFETPALSANRWLCWAHAYLPSALLQIFERLLRAMPKINRYVAYQLLTVAERNETKGEER